MQVELSLLCSPRLSQVTRVTQLLSGSHPANFSVKCPPVPRFYYRNVVTEMDMIQSTHSSHIPALVYGPHDRYLKAYCHTQSIQLFANSPGLCDPRAVSPILSPCEPILNTRASCDILDRFNFTRIKVSWHNAGRCQ